MIVVDHLTMKTYTDAAALPLAATVRGLPSFGDSQIDSQTLVAGSQFVSPSVIGVKAIKVGKTTGNIDGNPRASSIVTFDHENENGGERGGETAQKISRFLQKRLKKPVYIDEYQLRIFQPRVGLYPD